MVGSYPYTPADYIDIDFSDNGTVNINLPVSVDKTIGLTINEWLAVRKILEDEINSSDTEEVYRVQYKSILEKIKKIIPYSEARENEAIRKKLEEAIQKKKKLSFMYTGWKDEGQEERIVDPWFIFIEKNEYLVAYCNDRKGRRNFRLASISNPKVLEDNITNPLSVFRLNRGKNSCNDCSRNKEYKKRNGKIDDIPIMPINLTPSTSHLIRRPIHCDSIPGSGRCW
jgi:hypothetical protein